MKTFLTKKIVYIIIGALILLGSLLVYWFLSTGFNQSSGMRLVQIKKMRIKSEVAISPAAHYKGLSGRPSLCPNCGLLFVFSDSAIRSFVMRDMSFPLDIIFIKDGYITNIIASASSEDSDTIYLSQGPADLVLEINAGLSLYYGLEPGDEVKIENYED